MIIKSLGERCVEWSLSNVGVEEEPPKSNDGPLIRKWLYPCVRDQYGKKIPLKLSKVNWCCAFVCAAMQACILPDEKLPHDYRAGVVELVEDTSLGLDNKIPYSGRYVKISSIRDLKYVPVIGDLVIWNRANPSIPSTSWYRHINRIIEFNSNGKFSTVGGNENDMVRVANHDINEKNILGIVKYPQPEIIEPEELTEDEIREIMNSVWKFNRELIDNSVWGL